MRLPPDRRARPDRRRNPERRASDTGARPAAAGHPDARFVAQVIGQVLDERQRAPARKSRRR